MRKGILLVLFVLCVVATSRDLRAQSPGVSVFVSTQSGSQILKVDGNLGSFSIISSGNPFFNVNPNFFPEAMVVGPDGKLYIADPTDGLVVRMNQDGSQPEMAYRFSCDSGCPANPQGPSFSSSATGDLYFNTLRSNVGDGNGLWVISGAGTIPFGGAPGTAVNLMPDTCIVPACFIPSNGAGTAFDGTDNLLFVQQTGGGGSNLNSILSLIPPYTSGAAPTSLATGLHSPTAVALNPATGGLFVSDTAAGQILAVGTSTLYFGSFGNSNPDCQESAGNPVPELPLYMQFDGTGHLYVATGINSAGNCGEVWRIDPPITGGVATGTMLVDLVAQGDAVQSDQAVGIALPGTPGPAQTIGLSSAAGSFNFGWPVGCNPNASPSDCTYTFGVSYPSGMFPDGSTASVFPTITSEADWALRTPVGNPYHGTLLAPVAGEDGAGIIYSAECLLANGLPCGVPANTALTYTTSTTWKSGQPNYCGSGPGLLKADPIGSDDWINTLTSCTVISLDPTYGAKSKSKCTTSSCLSDWADVFGITGTAPVVTITTPPNGATYFLNQVVNASYSCNPPAGTSPVTACAGDVPNATPINTSSLGTQTFSVTANVSSGPAGSATTTYQVVNGPMASVSPTSVNFGNVFVGGFPIRIVTVTNTGNASLNITSVKVAPVPGGDSDDFFALSLCPKTLGVGKSCFILVSFFADADDFNPQSATLTITDNAAGSPQLVPMTATVIKRK